MNVFVLAAAPFLKKNIAENILPRFVHVRSCPELLFEGGVDGNKGRCCTLVASAQQALSRQDVDTPVRALATGVSSIWLVAVKVLSTKKNDRENLYWRSEPTSHCYILVLLLLLAGCLYK